PSGLSVSHTGGWPMGPPPPLEAAIASSVSIVSKGMLSRPEMPVAPIDRAAAAMIAVAADRSNDAQFCQTPLRRIVSQPAASAGRAGGIAAAAARRHAGGRGDGRLIWRRRDASRAGRLPGALHRYRLYCRRWGQPAITQMAAAGRGQDRHPRPARL